MVDLTESLLKAISIIADKTVEEVSSDTTIKAIVKKVVSASEGKYLVTYNNGDFYAYTQSGSTDVYDVNEQIYILVPEGDMSQKKFIIGKIESDKEDFFSKTLTSSLLNDYVTIGTNAVIDEGYGSLVTTRMQPLSLNPYKVNDFYYCYLRDRTEVNELALSYDSIDYPVLKIDEEVFSNSVKNAEALLLRAKFKASIDTENIGHYGLIVNIAFEDKTNPQIDNEENVSYPPKLIAYVLDTSKMTGNPMKFYDYTSQYIVSNFDGANYLYIDSIVAFSEGFVTQETIGNSNIYIDDIEIIALKENSAVNGDYKLKLTAPQGNTLREGRKDNLKIVATMTYLNKDVTKNTVFYWGIKDPSITSLSEDYNAKLGTGYRYLDIENTNELVLMPSNLNAAENIFACTGVYESDIILKTSISLYNNNNNLKITIESDQGTVFQFNEGNPTLTCLINDKLSNYQEDFPDSAFSFVWSKEDSEFGPILLDKTQAQLEREKENELAECSLNNGGVSNSGRSPMQILSYYSTQIAQIKDVAYLNGIHGPNIKCILKNINDYVTYSCSVYRGGIYIGYASITLQNSRSVINNNYYITIENGTQVFQYDEFGIAPNSIKQKEPIKILDLVAIFHSPQGAEVTPKKIRWIVPQENTLINIPSLGLETDIKTGEKYFVGNIYPLTIKENYNNNCNNNQLTVVVTHADGTEYRQSTNLLFTKVGEIGTNGTGTIVKINELLNIPNDECLTIIKPANINEAPFYNTGDSINSTILDTSLYTNNTQVLGHTTKWTLAGTSETQGLNYKVETEGGSCLINYDGSNNKLDTRIVEAQTNLKGKYFYNFYGIPAIEYQNNYTYENYPIKIMRDKTLKSILYDSNGTNPSYNENQGIHVELIDWPQAGYFEWEVESGPKTAHNDSSSNPPIITYSYENPNFLLSRNPRSKIGSEKLTIQSDLGSIESVVLEVQDTGKICADNSSDIIKNYINKFLADIENIGVDNILPISNKIELLWNRLAVFQTETPDEKNIHIKTVYEKYFDFFKRIEEEYQACKEINKESTKIYDKVQSIWNSEWPSIITNERLSLKENAELSIDDFNQLSDIYKNAYDDRSNDSENAVEIPVRTSTFNSDFINLLNSNDAHLQSLGNSIAGLQPILVEYATVLITYLNLLVNETQQCFVYSGEDENPQLTSLYDIIEDKYDLPYDDWKLLNNFGNKVHTIGKNIYDIITSDNDTETIANVYDNARILYKYYQTLYLNVKKYQIVEESKTLNVWNDLLNGKEPDSLNQIYIIPNESFNGLYMNNNAVGTVFIKENNSKTVIAKIYVPIIMTLNTYELAALNGWDGTNIEIGDDHIMTPQIGAGVKDDTTNTFTGMVMGVVSSTAEDENNLLKSNKTNKIGLVGYSNGKQSVFIDSETGKACFGLPEEDSGTSEGRIELVPGGVSKIGNWKIGNRFLYNIVNGSYERRLDKYSRSNNSEYKMMVPHDKHGIILSADQPYVHIKGEVYEDENLNGINYEDEYNNINPGDSLELRMDPDNKSLFSIIQHTSGFGDEDIEDLLFGYKASGTDNMTIVRNYVANENIDEDFQVGVDTEYYIYRLDTDANGNYKPYYKQEDISGFTKSGSWFTNSFISNNNVFLKNVLSSESFKKTTTPNPVFSVDSNTGIITYNSNNLIWTTNNSDINYWQNATELTSGEEELFVTFKYNKNIEDSLEQDVQIGQIQNNTNNRIYKIKIKNCILHRELINVIFNNSTNMYVQFYLVSNSNHGINEALLVSDKINLRNNQDNIDIDLFSFNNGSLINNSIYYLKMKSSVNNFIINADCSCTIGTSSSSYYAPPASPYGTIKITSVGSNSFVTSGGSVSSLAGNYSVVYQQNSSTWRLKINAFGYQKDNDTLQDILNTNTLEYDFVFWRQGTNIAIAGGQTIQATGFNSADPKARFFTTQETEWDQLHDYKDYNYAPTSANPWCITFYPKNTYMSEIIYQTILSSTSSQNSLAEQEYIVSIDYGANSESVFSETGSGDTATIINEDNVTTIKYKLNNSSIVTMSLKKLYNTIPNWGNWNNYNTNAKISWSLKLTDFNFGDILGYIPEDISKLCIENLNTSGLQGTAYSKTYWKNENNIINKRVRFFEEYYDWVNTEGRIKTQYGYIDVVNNGNKYYKFIKTLPQNIVNDFFENSTLNISHSNEQTQKRAWIWIDGLLSTFDNDLYWKEFVRVGLDENGRFFNAGLQDKKAYSRTGKIYAFGKVPDLYGQEIRVQTDGNIYLPIVKLFTQINSDEETVYITQGKNDNGNISVRTAGNNNYVELVASQYPSNDINTIPDKDVSLNISFDEGIKINNKGISLLEISDLNNEGKLFIQNHLTTLESSYIEVENDEKLAIISSNIEISCNEKIIDENPNNTNKYQINVDEFEINFQIENNQKNNNTTKTTSANLNINPTTLKLNVTDTDNYFIEINSSKNDNQEIINQFKAGQMGLIFIDRGNKDTTIKLEKDFNNYIEIVNTGIILDSPSVKIQDGGSEIIYCNGDSFKVSQKSIFNSNVYLNGSENSDNVNLYINGDLYVGRREDNSKKIKTIYLYDTEKKHEIKITAAILEQLYNWYNNCRWLIGCEGNTLFMRSVTTNANPEGNYSGGKQNWSIQTLLGHLSTYK